MPAQLPSILRRSLLWLGSDAAAALWQVLALVSLLGTAGLLTQHFAGYPFETTLKVGPADRITPYKEATGTYRWRLPSRYNNLVMDYRAEMLEDGRPMSKCLRSADVADVQATHYYIHNSAFIFGTGDGSDVRKNGHRYEVKVPAAVRSEWLIIALGLLALSATMWSRLATRRSLLTHLPSLAARVPVWVVAAAVLGLCVVDLVWNNDRSFGPMLVKGLPESDSAGWRELGDRLAEGRGLDNFFGAQRPFYAIYLAALTLVGGPALILAKSFNALLAALAAAGVFLMGRAMRCAWAGLGTAAYLALAEDHRHTIQTMLTENPGTALGVLAALTLVWALWKRSVWACALAGVITGLCSLSSGELILAVPLSAVLIACLGLFRFLPWKRSLVLLAVFTVGTSALLLPWMGVQKARHGLFTLTMNTPELLSGGADPVHGKLDRALHAEANALGFSTANVVGRYHYFAERYASYVKADPAGYVWRVLNASRESLSDLRANDPMIRLLLPLAVLGAGLLGTLRWRAPQPLLLATGLLLFLFNEDDPWPAPWLSLLILPLIFKRWKGRRLLALCMVLITVLSCMLLCGLSGNVASRRFWNVADWGLVLLWLAGSATLLQLIFAGVARVPLLGWGMSQKGTAARIRPASGGRMRECMPTAMVVAAFSLITLVMVLVRHRTGPQPEYSSAAVAAVLQSAPKGELQSQLVKFDDYVISLGRWEHAAHWRPYYYAARESRWLARPRLVMPDGTLGSRIVVEAPMAALQPPLRWQPALCVGKTTPMTDPLSGAPVPVLRVTEMRPVMLEKAR